MPYPKPCDITRGGCGKKFKPSGPKNRLCDDCRAKLIKKAHNKIKYQLIHKSPKLKSRNAPDEASCSICGIQCNGKQLIEARKGTYYPFCTYHFSAHRSTDLKELRELIKQDHL